MEAQQIDAKTFITTDNRDAAWEIAKAAGAMASSRQDTDKGIKVESFNFRTAQTVTRAINAAATEAAENKIQAPADNRGRRMVDYYTAKKNGMNHGRPFRASEDHPSTHGISPDLVGEFVCYVYPR